jgi:hypothetical protein
LSLSDAGITSIGLEIRGLAKLDSSLAQNQILGRTEVGRANGTTTSAFDVALYFKSRNEAWRPDEDCGCHVPTEPQPILIAESGL